jgi:hypothetical protein
MSENPTIKSNPIITEAPASWNTKYITPDGFVCQLTLRGESGKDLLEKANAALTWLKDNGYQPCENTIFRPRNNGSKPENNAQANKDTVSDTNSNGNNTEHTTNICPIHHAEMKRWEKGGKIWFSHKVEGGWCTGKSK